MIDRTKDLVRRGLQSRTVDSTLWLGSSSAINGFLGAVSAAILARVLGVEEYGVYILIISLITLLTDISDLGVSSSIVRFGSESIAEGDDRKLRSVIAIVSRWKLIIGGVVIALAIVFLDTLAGYIFKHVDEKISTYFLLALVAAVLGIVAGIFTPIYQSFKKFRLYSMLLSTRSVVKIVAVIVLVYLVGSYSIPTLIWMEIAVLALFLGLMYAYSPFKRISLFTSDKTLEKEMWSFNKWLSLYQAIALIGGRLDMAFIGGLSDAHALGLYGSASKISGLLSAVSSSYMSVLLSELSSSLSTEVLLRKQRHAWMMVFVIIGGIGLVALSASPLIHILFGNRFDGAVSILQILCVGVAFTVLAYPVNATLFALNKSEIFPVMSIIALLIFVGANIELVPRFAAVGAAMSFVMSSVVSFLISGGYYLWIRKSLQIQ